jgi:hypothetical protein
MKKILIVIAFIILICIPNIKAIELSSYKSGYFVKYTKNNEDYFKEISYYFVNGSNNYFNYLRMDNIFDFKIEKNNNFNLGENEKFKIEKILYYGLNFRNHNDIVWYIVDQFRIWQIMYPDFDLKLVDYKGIPISKLDGYFKELDNDIINSNTIPSFGLEISTNLRVERSFVDYNNIIQDYYFTCSDITCIIENNKLTIFSIKPGKFDIFGKKKFGEENFAIYSNKDNAFVNGSNGFINYFKIRVNVLGTKFTIKCVGETNWGLYEGDKLLKTIKVTDFYQEEIVNNPNYYLKNLDDNNTVYKILINNNNFFNYYLNNNEHEDENYDENEEENEADVLNQNIVDENPSTLFQKHYILFFTLIFLLIMNIVFIFIIKR